VCVCVLFGLDVPHGRRREGGLFKGDRLSVLALTSYTDERWEAKKECMAVFVKRSATSQSNEYKHHFKHTHTHTLTLPSLHTLPHTYTQ
jgi:hypothetical protein